MTASGLYPRVFSNLPFILRLTALNLIGNIPNVFRHSAIPTQCKALNYRILLIVYLCREAFFLLSFTRMISAFFHPVLLTGSYQLKK